MLIWSRTDSADFYTIKDMVDHLFVNLTRPARFYDLSSYMLLIFIPFFAQCCITNSPVDPEYQYTRAGYTIRILDSFILIG